MNSFNGIHGEHQDKWTEMEIMLHLYQLYATFPLKKIKKQHLQPPAHIAFGIE